MNQILKKAASTATVALLGYEIGTNVHHNEPEPKQQVSDNHIEKEVLYGLIIVIVILVVFLIKYWMKKTPNCLDFLYTRH